MAVVAISHGTQSGRWSGCISTDASVRPVSPESSARDVFSQQSTEVDTAAQLAFRWTLITLAAAQLVAGCATKHAPYPAEWAPSKATTPVAATESAADCPDISGRYSNSGTLAPDTPQELCKSAMHIEFRMIGDWFCETSLSLNLVSTDAGGTWIDVRQPDSDTLVVVFPDDVTADAVELHRSRGDFECSVAGLTRTLRAPITSLGYDEGKENTATQVYNVFSGVTNVLIATGGMQTLRRTFTRASDGSLVMKVERGTHGLMFGLPVNYDYSTYVTWPPAQDEGTVPTEALVAPSTTIARIRPFRQHAFARIWLVAVDGQELETGELINRLYDDRAQRYFWDVTQAVEPGTHWVEHYAMQAPTTRYGTVVELQAGHSYRLAEAPPKCDPPTVDKAAADVRQLAWRELVVEDAVPNGVTTQRRVRALCGTSTRRCQTDADCTDTHCTVPAGSTWGLCGLMPKP
jgi:hypothetical protein